MIQKNGDKKKLYAAPAPADPADVVSKCIEEARNMFLKWKAEILPTLKKKPEVRESGLLDVESIWHQFIEATSNSNVTKS